MDHVTPTPQLSLAISGSNQNFPYRDVSFHLSYFLFDNKISRLYCFREMQFFVMKEIKISFQQCIIFSSLIWFSKRIFPRDTRYN